VIRQHVLDLLCAKTGGPCIYTGQDMKTVHAGLGISEADWQASVDDFGMTARKFNIPPDLLSQIVALLNAVKPDIVTRQ
jgi:hemoglobin